MAGTLQEDDLQHCATNPLDRMEDSDTSGSIQISGSNNNNPQAAIVRKRRMELRKAAASQPKTTNLANLNVHSHKNSRKVPKYDPETPMSKEEAAAWRREARRVRNRQSAAASREKTRVRIQELEELSSYWQDKYLNLKQKVHEFEVHSGKVISEDADAAADDEDDDGIVQFNNVGGGVEDEDNNNHDVVVVPVVVEARVAGETATATSDDDVHVHAAHPAETETSADQIDFGQI